MKTDGNGNPCFDVRDFGALGDGVCDDTVPIQRAIDACARGGGGVVTLYNGSFLSGSLMLRSHVELRLASTATLLGASDLAQYRRDKKTPYRILDRALIYAEGCEHVAITGQGTIDGQGRMFSQGKTWIEAPQPHADKAWDEASGKERFVLVRLRDCRNVRIEGVLLKDSPSFCVHPIHCRHLRIEGMRIDSRVMPNSDGIDVDGCQDVFISNCEILSSDDSIALKTLEHGMSCRDIVITNCILSSWCAAIRIGPDALCDIERVAVSNCVIRDTELNGIKIQEAFGAAMRDMVFSNIVMDNVGGPISLRLAGWKVGTNVWAVFDDSAWEKGELRNILFDNIRGRAMAKGPKLGAAKQCMSITGTSRTRPNDITFSNINITFPGGGTAQEAECRNVPDFERSYPEACMFGVLPAYGLYVHHAAGITLNNVQFRLESGDLRPALVCDDVQNLDLLGFKAEMHSETESLIRLQNTQKAFIACSRALNSTGPFLRVEGTASRELYLDDNTPGHAGKPVQVSGE